MWFVQNENSKTSVSNSQSIEGGQLYEYFETILLNKMLVSTIQIKQKHTFLIPYYQIIKIIMIHSILDYVIYFM